MSIRIYVNEDIVATHFVDQARRCKSRGMDGAVDHLGMKIHVDGDGRLYYQLTEDVAHPAIAIPRPLQEHVLLISWWTRIPSVPHRALGVYEWRDMTPGYDADAQLDVDPQDPKNWRRLIICGRCLASMSRLYSEIRSGKAILTESWEDELPRAQPTAHAQLLPPAGE